MSIRPPTCHRPPLYTLPGFPTVRLRRPGRRAWTGRAAGDPGDQRADEGSLDVVVAMMGAFLLLALGLMLAVSFAAAQAASAGAQRALQVVQEPGGRQDVARQVAARLSTSSGMVTDVQVAFSGTPDSVATTVTVRTVLGNRLVRTAAGPRLRFVPQQP